MLQVLESIEGDPKAGLAANLNHFATAAGARRLRAWLCRISAAHRRQCSNIFDAAGAGEHWGSEGRPGSQSGPLRDCSWQAQATCLAVKS